MSAFDLDALVDVLAPRAGGARISEFLEATRQPAVAANESFAAELVPFGLQRREALQALSSGFQEDPLLRRDPASMAVAFWMRRANVARIGEEYKRRSEEGQSRRVPVGRVFHVAPSNVDTLFIYSWALSFLCGNANVVRVSQERSLVVEAMLRVIDRVATERAQPAPPGANDPELRDRNRFVTYAHDEQASTAISAWCSHRVIWGGDETVAALRPLPLPSHASERVFGSKFSYSVGGAAGYLAANEGERTRLAEGFFNDVFFFDQMACSSPHVIFWIGAEAETARAIEALERDLERVIERREHPPSTPDAVRRRDFAFRLAANADVRVGLQHPGFVSIRVFEEKGLVEEKGLAKEICGGGLIRHYRIARAADLIPYADDADQTVTHFGLRSEDIETLANGLGARGVDRILPVGEALAFDWVWDGFDLLDDFTRRVRVR